MVFSYSFISEPVSVFTNLFLDHKSADPIRHVFSILMEQSQDIVTDCGGLQRNTCGLLIMWLLLVFLVGNAYKGVLFTLLTTVSFPAVPKTLEQVVRSDFSVVSTHKLKLANGSIVCNPKFQINALVENMDEGKLNISNLDLYIMLNESIVFLSDHQLQLKIFVAIEKIGMVRGLNGKYTVSPKNLIILDPEIKMEGVKELYSLLTNNKKLILGQKLDLLPGRLQWLFRRNALVRLASPILL